MKNLTVLAAALAATTMFTTPALAGSPDGKIQVKLLGTAVLPDGKISTINSVDTTTAFGAVAASVTGPQSVASDNVVPTLAIEYFVTPNVSVETICCTTKHHVNGTGGLAGTNLVNSVLIVPATFTLKYHLPLGAIKPYVGAGPTWFIVLDDKPGATPAGAGITRTHLSSDLGVAVQGGADIAIGQTGYSLSLDAKKYWVNTTANWYQGSTLALSTKHKLDPWVLSAGIGYRF